MNTNKVIQSITLFAMSIGVLTLYWLVYLFDPELHRIYLQGEDRVVEWLTFTFFLLSSIVTFSMIKYRDEGWRDLCYLLMMGSFLFICSGEEISWGQRVFGFQTPDAIKIINTQNELNFHNISFENIHPYGIISWFISLYGLVLPLLLFKKAANPESMLRKYLSPLPLAPCYLFALIIRSTDDYVKSVIVRYSGSDTVHSYITQASELQELFWGLCFLLSAISIFRVRKKSEVKVIPLCRSELFN